MDPLPSMLILIALTVICAIIEISSKAVMSQNQNSIKKLFDEDSDNFKKLSATLENDAKIGARADTAIIFISAAISALAAVAFGNTFADLEFLTVLGTKAASYISLAAVFVLAVLAIEIIGRNLPAKIAVKYTDKLCVPMLPFLLFVTAVFAPLHAVVDFISSLFARIAGVTPEDITEDVTEDEIRQMIDEGRESGSIEESETDMIHSIFEFDDREVSEILTHRTDITAVEQSASLEEVITVIKEGGFSRIPVYKESLDDVVGILYVKDLIKLLDKDFVLNPDTFNLSDYIRKALYIPESKSLKELFEKFKSERIQMAVVVDEYGGTLGIVTMEDLIESIMGSINDEFDEASDEEEECDIRAVSDNEYIVKGLTLLKNVEEAIGVTFDNEEDCDTVGGLVVSLLGVIPGEDERPELDIGNVNVKVLSVVEHRIEELFITVNEVVEQNENGDENND